MATKLFRRVDRRTVFDEITERAEDGPTDGMDRQTQADDAAADAADQTESDGSDASSSAVEDGPKVEDIDTDAKAETGGEQSTRSRGGRWLARLAVVLAAIAFVAACSATGFFGWQYQHQRDVDNAARSALAAAEQFAVTLTSIDTNAVDANFIQVVDNSTGDFKDMYSQSASQLRQVLIDNKAMSKGTVVDSAVKSATKTEVKVVLFVDQWITNTASPQPRLDRSRVAMTMQLVDGRWLASSVELK
jgi:Mce-associated membrane protein